MEKLVWCSNLVPITKSYSLLTYAECDVKQAHTDIQAEEKNRIGHLTEHEDVAYMLFHGDGPAVLHHHDGAEKHQDLHFSLVQLTGSSTGFTNEQHWKRVRVPSLGRTGRAWTGRWEGAWTLMFISIK